MKRISHKLYGIAFGIALLLIWQIIAVVIDNSFMMPSPVDVAKSLWENRAELFMVHLPATMEEVLLGGAAAVLIGAIFAIMMDASVIAERAIYPLLTISQTIPTLCIAPIFILWLGYTIRMRVLVVILMNFFSVTINLFDGLKSTQTEKSELMRTFGASSGQQFFHLRLPTALPYLFTALEVALPWSVVGAAVSEWLGAPAGLGHYSRRSLVNLDAAGLLAPLVILTVISIALNAILKLIEKKVVTWKGEV